MEDTYVRHASIRAFFMLALSSVLLSSCWSSDKKTEGGTQENTPKITSSEIDKKAMEDARINNLATLTTDNLATQVYETSGKKTLNNHSLFINYLNTGNADTINKLIDRLEEIEGFAKRNKVEISEVDSMVMISGFHMKNAS